MDDSKTIEGEFAIVKLDLSPPPKRYQVTIKAKTDHKLSQVENIIVELEKVDKFSVATVLAGYLEKRTNRMEVRSIFREYILGQGPVFVKDGRDRYEVVYRTREHDFIEAYTLIFLEL